ncbi:MAG: DUF5317 domain-containing protein [Actinomycetia bacterium]|nr:DUF5317 domain-containing protein [Actinomycetes bacterium]
MLVLTGVAIVIGLAVGLARGGSWRSIAKQRVHWWPVLIVGAALPVLVDTIHPPGGAALQIAGLVILVGVAARNLMIRGMGVILVGLTLNLLVVAANTTMPVRLDALVDAGIIEADRTGEVSLRGPRHLEDDTTRLAFLGDIIPFRPTREVTSFGDLILVVGLTAALAHLPLPRRRFRGTDDPFADLTDERDELIDQRTTQGLDAGFLDLRDPADLPDPADRADHPDSMLVDR